MSNLASKLEKYYTKRGNRLIFGNGLSLNQLALSMWELSDCKGVDASVLSRVINGKRLFTTAQLDAFCKVLGIPDDEATVLRNCLDRDHAMRIGVHETTLYLPNSLAQQTVHHLSKCSVTQFYAGNYDDVRSSHELIAQFMAIDQHKILSRKATAEDAGISLYMLGRALSNSELPSLVGRKIRPIFDQLLFMSKSSGSALLYGLGHNLLANAYYGAGGYSYKATKLRCYRRAMHHASIAINALPADNHERLFAYRTMVASASYIGDMQTIMYVFRHFKRDLRQQPEQNYINGIHLGITLSKALSGKNNDDPFWVRDLATSHFERTLSNTGAIEVSEIKEELETLALLNCQDAGYIRDRVALGQSLANQYDLKRHSVYFQRLARSI